MDKPTKWLRVTKAAPCQICHKPDFCGFSDDGEVAICMRVESDKPTKNGGWRHFLKDKPIAPHVITRAKAAKPVTIDASALMRGWRSITTPDQYEAHASALGITAQAIRDYGAAYAPEHHAWAWPMYDEKASGPECCIGIRLRDSSGKKWAVTGSHSGFFFPFGAMFRVVAHTVVICEGGTDACAALDMGLFAIGRPSCRGGEENVMDALRQLGPNDAVMIYDNDGPGVDGARKLADMIAKKWPLRRFVPPTKDLRAFVRSGGTRELFMSSATQMRRTAPGLS